MPSERRASSVVERTVSVSPLAPARGPLASRCLRAARRAWFAPLLLGATTLAPAAVPWRDVLRQPTAWYATPEARAVADSVLRYQTASGGWPKNLDMTAPPTAEFLADTRPDHRAATIDNDATTTQVWLLARVGTALGADGAPHRAAALRGLDYLLAAQYPNGGWPQYFPLRSGYFTHITYNDDAMANVLEVLRELAAGRAPFTFVDTARRTRAADAVQRGLVCLLRTQVRQDGRLTAWCAQHDADTLAPAWARNFEPPSLSGFESVGLVRFLMSVEQPTPEIRAAVEGAVAWFRAVTVRGLRVVDTTDPAGKRDRRAVADPAAPALWARFYELGTNRPIFTGRDRVIRYDFNLIEQERRAGYGYLGDWPARLLERDYPRWLAAHPPAP